MKPRVRIRDGKPVLSAVPIHSPNPDVIVHLEKLLALARNGELRSIMEICEWDDGSVSGGWSLHSHAQIRRMLGEFFVLMVDQAFGETHHAENL